MPRRVVLLFVKYPEPGKVKTRLAVTLGMERAAEIYRRLVAAVCARVPAELELVAHFDPPQREPEIKEWLAGIRPTIRFIPQSRGDLGSRLEYAFHFAFTHGFEQVAVIGSDCIELRPELFEETWRALEQTDCVIGPAEDGGYYLIALRRPWPALFTGIDWSTNAVLAQTLRRAEVMQLRVHRLETLSDIDTADDWCRAESRLKN